MAEVLAKKINIRKVLKDIATALQEAQGYFCNNGCPRPIHKHSKQWRYQSFWDNPKAKKKLQQKLSLNFST